MTLHWRKKYLNRLRANLRKLPRKEAFRITVKQCNEEGGCCTERSLYRWYKEFGIKPPGRILIVPKELLYKKIKAQSAKRGIQFELTIEQVCAIVRSPCNYCGIKYSSVTTQSNHRPYKHNGIDRIDSSIGYLLNNCVAACRHCNFAKARMSVSQFKKWLRRAYFHCFRIY